MSVKSRPRVDLNWILVVLLTVFAVAPLTYPGFFQAHSGFLPALNVEHISSAPNWGRVPDLVRGEGRLPYLLIWPFFNWSGSGIAAVKWGYGLAFALGALGVYFWLRGWLGARGAVLASMVYIYLPWHLGTVYVRGAIAEAWLWALWPFVLWAIDRLVERRFLVAAVVGFPALTAAFLIQPGLAALSIPLLAAYGVVVDVRSPWPAARLIGALALPLLLLWLVSRIVQEARIPFFEHFVYPFQLLSAAWGDALSFQLGLAAVGLSVVAVALWLSRRAEGEHPSAETVPVPPDPSVLHPVPFHLLGRVLWFWVIALVVLVLSILPVAAVLWEISGFDAFLTYPWQLLALVGLPLAFLAGSVAKLDRRLAALPAWAGLLAFVVLASYPYLAPRFTQVDPGSKPLAMFQPLEADTAQIMLLDYEAAPPTEITPTMTLTLTWQAVEPVAGDYTVFVHALAEGDGKLAQRDTRPCEGECPTDTWQPGQIIIDRYELDLATGAPPGPLQLAVGLYLLDTGERAVIIDRDDRTVFLDVP